jgi:hypothetical protein
MHIGNISNQGRVIRMGFMAPVSAVRIQAVSADDYLAELNHRLRMHPDFRPGMQFVRHPEGGYDWEPKGYLAPFTEVSTIVRRLYVIAPNKP